MQGTQVVEKIKRRRLHSRDSRRRQDTIWRKCVGRCQGKHIHVNDLEDGKCPHCHGEVCGINKSRKKERHFTHVD